ncbi:UNVERIFIED_CONTAM: Aminoacylase-1 [Sesamum calycinum]|uniref:Aminoacylase-1 n=1 Tax=Sesamum calycinum TaxID=2727403 RepID=A0AAW2MQM7_9LAMI
MVIKATGAPGHGAKLYDNTAMENLLKSIESVRRFRAAQFDMVKAGLKAEGEVISVNMVFLEAGTPSPTGFVMNLQPSEAQAGFDIRVPPTADVASLERRIAEEWAPATRNMTFEFLNKNEYLRGIDIYESIIKAYASYAEPAKDEASRAELYMVEAASTKYILLWLTLASNKDVSRQHASTCTGFRYHPDDSDGWKVISISINLPCFSFAPLLERSQAAFSRIFPHVERPLDYPLLFCYGKDLGAGAFNGLSLEGVAVLRPDVSSIRMYFSTRTKSSSKVAGGFPAIDSRNLPIRRVVRKILQYATLLMSNKSAFAGIGPNDLEGPSSRHIH